MLKAGASQSELDNVAKNRRVNRRCERVVPGAYDDDTVLLVAQPVDQLGERTHPADERASRVTDREVHHTNARRRRGMVGVPLKHPTERPMHEINKQLVTNIKERKSTKVHESLRKSRNIFSPERDLATGLTQYCKEPEK